MGSRTYEPGQDAVAVVQVKVTWLGLEPRTLSLKGRCSTN